MKIYIVRHAQSERNVGIKSDKDNKLTKTGEEQAERLGIWFHKVKIDRIYCSELKRAKETLSKMKEQFNGIPITYTSQLNEMDLGIFEENGFDEVKEFFREAYKNKRDKYYEYRPKNGESIKDLNIRASKFYKKIKKNHKEENILIIGHGLFIKQLIINIMNLKITETKYFEIPNASVSQFYIKKDKITDFHVGDFHHLLLESIEKNKRPKLLLKKR